MFRAQQNAFDDAVGKLCWILELELLGVPAAGGKLDPMAKLRRSARDS
jgi:hypothetical protein